MKHGPYAPGRGPAYCFGCFARPATASTRTPTGMMFQTKMPMNAPTKPSEDPRDMP